VTPKRVETAVFVHTGVDVTGLDLVLCIWDYLGFQLFSFGNLGFS